MAVILDSIDEANGIVLASPMNFGTVTAVMKRFIERLVCYGYWPWGVNAPQARTRVQGKRAILVASSAAPALVARLSSQIIKIMKSAAALLGAKPVGVVFIGLAAQQQKQDIGERKRRQARELGRVLVGGRK